MQHSGRRELDDRLTLRANVGARFVESYVQDVFRHERRQAQAFLAGLDPTEEQFRWVAESLGYPSAVLLDNRGRVLQVSPPAPALIGQDLTGRYDHLRIAVAGQEAISTVVPSAALGTPIVAFAVPFDTPAGRRVFSGGFDVWSTPLASFLAGAVPITPNQTYLVDALDAVVTSNGASGPSGATLTDHDPALARAFSRAPSGRVTADGVTRYFTSSPVAGTSWRLVLAVPVGKLHAPVDGSRARGSVAAGRRPGCRRPGHRRPRHPGERQVGRGRRGPGPGAPGVELQVPVPGQHEPRDPHPDERRHGHDRAAARHRPRRTSSATIAETVQASADVAAARSSTTSSTSPRSRPASSTSRPSTSTCARVDRGRRPRCWPPAPTEGLELRGRRRPGRAGDGRATRGGSARSSPTSSATPSSSPTRGEVTRPGRARPSRRRPAS